MLRLIVFINVFCVFFVTSYYIKGPGPETIATKGEIWPKPKEQVRDDTYYKLIPSDFTFKEPEQTCDILKTAIDRYANVLKNIYNIAERYSDIIRSNTTISAGLLQELQINLNAPCESYPYLEMNEKYSLNVSAVSTLNSDSIWGILRGLETFVQLFYINDTDVLINSTQITDEPKYPHRGLLIDTARHYLTVPTILNILDGMEMNKMNVLHWHIVDDQSFPYQSDVFPDLSRGAFFPTMKYTAANISQITNYARDRGIRVIPEFDMPGHTRSWGVAFPNILTTCYNRNNEVDGLGPMDPTKNKTYQVIEYLLKEVKQRFPDKYFHVGGDEVDSQCWRSNPQIKEFMKEHNITQTGELHSYFMSKALPLLGESAKPIVWQEVFDVKVSLPNGTVVQVWKNTGWEKMTSVNSTGRSQSVVLDYMVFGPVISDSLNVSAVSTLNSDSIWGILRGLETFVQLFYINDTDVLINSTQITDEPKYPHRGLLIDTARHYLTVPTILNILDGMEMNKMNVLHWHIVDDQSFPYQSDVFPDLSRGAFFPTMKYTAANISQITNYARDRGIRVIPEFDMPGHTRSWGVAFPNILTTCYNRNNEVDGLGPMDPTKNKTYQVIEYLLKEVKQRFPDKYFHVGGDEVDSQCWRSNPQIKEFMKEHNITQTGELHSYFMSKALPLLGESAKPIVWQEVFDVKVSLPNGTVVQVWKNTGWEKMTSILRAGHKVLFSTTWYLDHVREGGDWAKFYSNDPRDVIRRYTDQVNFDDVLGGEACMWAEVVDDNNVISRIWPRASAVAEILWSGGPKGPFGAFQSSRLTYDDTLQRIEEHACRMNRRGVHAQPPNGPGFCLT